MSDTRSTVQARKRRDLFTLVLAVALLVGGGLVWLSGAGEARERREATLASVPDFPRKGQAPRPKPRPVEARAQVAAPAQARPAPAAPPKGDRLNAFLAASPQDRAIAMLQVNALLNTPLFERIKECLPRELGELQEAASSLGLDFERDIDRVAMLPPGAMAMTGFFEGKDVAGKLMEQGGVNASSRTYRGGTLYEADDRCTAQVGNLLLLGRGRDGCQALVDRTLDAPAQDSGEVFGDVYLRVGETGLQSQAKRVTGTEQGNVMAPILEAMKGVTVRANVWDSVAVTVEGEPRTSKELRELVQMARGAVSLARTQLDDEQVELRTLAELADVTRTDDGKMQMDLAVPSKDLFEKLHFPCPGKDGYPDGGTD